MNDKDLIAIREAELARLRRQVELQQRAIETMRASVARGPAQSRAVTVGPRLKSPAPRPRRAPLPEVVSVPGWPSIVPPKSNLAPPPGLAAYSLAGSRAPVTAFAVFGLEGAALEQAVASVAERQRTAMNFVPVFLTDCADHVAFRRRGYVFEYFPPNGATLPTSREDVQPKLGLVEAKWNVELRVNLGLPWFDRDGRSLEQRYLAARAAFAAGKFATAQDTLGDFASEAQRQSKKRVHGRPLPRPTASIVIVSNVDREGVELALKSLSRQISKKNIELVIVDNGNPGIESIAGRLIPRFTFIKAPFDIGCSAGRNLGAHYATAPYIIFLDDDGVAEEGCVEALLACMVETGALAVRGRVTPLTLPENGSAHYDRGLTRVPSVIDCEGVSIWRREPFVEMGGFDPLLVGHEGLALCCKLWRFEGPLAFLYEPNAVLKHDYAANPASTTAKGLRHKLNDEYLSYLGLRHQEIRSAYHKLRADPLSSYSSVARLYYCLSDKVTGPTVSVLTTARNASLFVEEYTKSWKSQRDGNFELVFVDDRSDDGTLDRAVALWDGDDRFRPRVNAGSGRGAALNTAMSLATGDICLIADVDDLSIPERILRTRIFFAEVPEYDCMSFIAFNEQNPWRYGPPRSLYVDDVRVRQLFGMPVQFPAFAFRRNRLTARFDETLSAGIDCEWLYRNSRSMQLKGRIIFVPAVYYREHDAQISRTGGQQQREVRRRSIERSFEEVLGDLDSEDRRFIEILTGTRSATAHDKASLAAWVAKFLDRNRRCRVYDPPVLERALHEGLREVTIHAARN